MEESDLLTVVEVAAALRVDGSTVRRWIHQGILEAVQLPGMQKYRKYRIKRTELNRIMGKSA